MQYPRYQGLDPDDDGDDFEEDDHNDDYPDLEYDMADLEPEPLGREADFLYDPLRDRIGEFE